jgi:hypothetical protein
MQKFSNDLNEFEKLGIIGYQEKIEDTYFWLKKSLLF